MDGLTSYLLSKKYTEEQFADISASINSSGHLIIAFADGNAIDCGDAKGADGADYVLTNQDKTDIAALAIAGLNGNGVPY